MATVRFVRQTSPGKYLEKQCPGHWPLSIWRCIHPASWVSCKATLVASYSWWRTSWSTRTMRQMDPFVAPNGTCLIMFIQDQDSCRFRFFLLVAEFLQLALTLTVFWVPWPGAQCRQDVQVDWKLSWEDLKVKLRKLFDTSEDAFNQFSMGNLVASLGPKQVKTLNWLMVIDQLAYRDWSETMITHPGNTPEPTRTWIYPPAETCGWSIRDHLALVPSSTSTVYNTCI